ncbi:MAG: hypothetical protein U5N53_18510 [Mycobacterium sp.]|nr:hypothetical protein [Mycobacterium sp.]
MTAPAEQFPCTSWCTENGRHFGYVFRGDQSCWGPQRKVVFSLDDYAPAVGITEIPCEAAGITVYPYQGWYQLAKVKLNVFWEPGSGDAREGIDHDFLMTPSEAIEMATNLIRAVETIAEGCGPS